MPTHSSDHQALIVAVAEVTGLDLMHVTDLRIQNDGSGTMLRWDSAAPLTGEQVTAIRERVRITKA